MIRVVTTMNDLNRFVFFVRNLYKTDPIFAPPIYAVLKKELKKQVLIEKKYTALLALDHDEVVGRILYTIAESKHEKKSIGYFSFFDVIENQEVAKALLDAMETDLREQGIDYVEGTFSPYDPDTRRGILVQGFDRPHSFLTSYNYSYYGPFLEEHGYQKAYDTITVEANPNERNIPKLQLLERFFTSRHQDIRVDSINLKNIEKEIEDVHHVFSQATNEIIYQDAPSMEMIADVAKNMKMFLQPDLIKIAREVSTGEPVGFCLVIPDFNQVLQKTKGKILSIHMLRSKKIITRARGMLQYVVPKYQNTGLIAYIFKKIYDHFDELGITEFEAGTMMEENIKAMATFFKLDGKITKVYRLYGKEIST